MAQDVGRQHEQYGRDRQAQQIEELVVIEPRDRRRHGWQGDAFDAAGQAGLLFEDVWRRHAQGEGGKTEIDTLESPGRQTDGVPQDAAH